jgi:Esterase FrsA-like
MFTFSNSIMFDFELTRILGSTSSGGCDVGEFKSAVGKIKKCDAEFWYAAWKEQGELAERIGDEAAKAGFKGLARNAYLRASNYFRTTPYMFANEDARVIPFAERSIRNFERATTLMDGEVVFMEIPYENGLSLSGYLCLPPRDARLPGKTPVVMYAGGGRFNKGGTVLLVRPHGASVGVRHSLFRGPRSRLAFEKVESSSPARI